MALDEDLQAQITQYLAPQDLTARKQAETERIKAETELALQQRIRAIKNAAAARSGLDFGGYAGEVGDVTLQAKLMEQQRINEANKQIEAEDLSRRQFGIESGLKYVQPVQEREFQAQQNEMQRKWQTGERLSTQEFQLLSQEKQRDYEAEQANIERVWKSGERTSEEAFQVAQAALTKAWQTGERIATEVFQKVQTEYTTAHEEAMNNAKLAQQQGQFEEQLGWEREAQRLQQEHQIRVQQMIIESDDRRQKSEIEYKKTIDGYFDATGKYIPGISELQRQADRAFQVGESEKERELRLQIAQLQKEAEDYKTETTRASSETSILTDMATGASLGSILPGIGTVGGAIIGGAGGLLNLW